MNTLSFDVFKTHKYPHPISVDSFVEQHEEIGHSRAYRHTGNARSRREVEGVDLIHLALYRTSCPKATLAKLNTYLFEINRHDPTYIVHSNSQLCQVQFKINLTRKRSSPTAYQVMEPRNVTWRDNYWNMGYPFGIANIDPIFVIDLD